MTQYSDYLGRDIIVEEFTPEFLTDFAGIEEDEIEDELEAAAERFEQNFNAVAIVTRMTGMRYKVTIIPARRADNEEMSRATQALFHWLDGDSSAK